MSKEQINALQENDEGAWKEFLEAYWGIIFRLARMAGLDGNEAETVTQAVMIGAVQNLRRFDRSRGSFKAWVLSFARWYIGHHSPKGDNKV